MAETATVGELVVRIRADISDLERGLAKTQGLATGLATRTAPSLRAVSNAFRGLAFSAVGVPGPIGRVSAILLTMGTGGTVTLAVLAGLAAIGAALKLLSLQADRAAARIKEMAEAAFTRGAHERGIMRVLAQILNRQPSPEQQLRNIGATIGFIQQQMALRVPEEGVFGILGETRLRFTTEQLEQMRQAIQLLRQDAEALATPLRQLRAGQIAGPPGLAEETRLRGIGQVPGGLLMPDPNRIQAQINAILAAAARRAQQADDLRTQWRDLGFTLGDYFLEGFRAATEGGIGGFLKSLGFTILRGVIFGAIAGATGGTFGAGFAAGSGIPIPGQSLNRAAGPSLGSVLDFSTFPPAQNPLAAARDREWQRFFRESGLVAVQGGYR